MEIKTSDEDDHVLIHDGECVLKIPYDWGLAGRDGAWFVLKPGPDATREHISAAKSCLYRNRDVVTMKVERSANVR